MPHTDSPRAASSDPATLPDDRLTVNQVRAMTGLEPIPGGDDLRVTYTPRPAGFFDAFYTMQAPDNRVTVRIDHPANSTEVSISSDRFEVGPSLVSVEIGGLSGHRTATVTDDEAID